MGLFSTWTTKNWSSHSNKHRPPPRVVWSVLVEESGSGGVAYYHPDLELKEQQELELRCIELDDSGQLVQGVCLSESNSKCTFWMDAKKVVGASNGEETSLIHVEWASGTVHGRPISRDELRRKGAVL